MSKLIERIDLSSPEVEGDINKIFELPKDKARFYFYRNKFSHQFFRVTLSIYDDKITLSFFNTRIAMGKGGPYRKNTLQSGLTYNKETKKVRVWMGGSIKALSQHNEFTTMLNHLGHDWLTNERGILYPLLTNTLLAAVLSGKITNPVDYCNKFVKVSLKLKVSPKLLYQTIKDYSQKENVKGKSWDMFSSATQNLNNYIFTLKNLLRLSVVPDNLLKRIKKSGIPEIANDMVDQCMILDRQINFNWSDARLMNEHNKMSVEILELEVGEKEFRPLDYVGDMPPLNGATLLTNERDVFMEAKIQGHCLYSMYWNKIERKEYFALTMDYPERCTIGLNYGSDSTIMLNQIYGKRNKSVTNETRWMVNNWLNLTKVQEFFKSQIPKKSDWATNEIRALYDDLPF